LFADENCQFVDVNLQFVDVNVSLFEGFCIILSGWESIKENGTLGMVLKECFKGTQKEFLMISKAFVGCCLKWF
jgi:hypothetical protein